MNFATKFSRHGWPLRDHLCQKWPLTFRCSLCYTILRIMGDIWTRDRYGLGIAAVAVCLCTSRMLGVLFAVSSCASSPGTPRRGALYCSINMLRNLSIRSSIINCTHKTFANTLLWQHRTRGPLIANSSLAIT